MWEFDLSLCCLRSSREQCPPRVYRAGVRPTAPGWTRRSGRTGCRQAWSSNVDGRARQAVSPPRGKSAPRADLPRGNCSWRRTRSRPLLNPRSAAVCSGSASPLLRQSTMTRLTTCAVVNCSSPQTVTTWLAINYNTLTPHMNVHKKILVSTISVDIF